MSINSEFEVKRLGKENEDLKKEVSAHKQLIGDMQAYIGHLKKGREFGMYTAIVNAKLIATPTLYLSDIIKDNPGICFQIKQMVDGFDETLYPNKLDFTKESNDA